MNIPTYLSLCWWLFLLGAGAFCNMGLIRGMKIKKRGSSDRRHWSTMLSWRKGSWGREVSNGRYKMVGQGYRCNRSSNFKKIIIPTVHCFKKYSWYFVEIMIDNEYITFWTSLVAQMVKNPPAVWETWIWSLGQEDSPGGGHGNSLQALFLPGESPWTEEPGGLQSMALQRVGHDWMTKHGTAYHIFSSQSSLRKLNGFLIALMWNCCVS